MRKPPVPSSGNLIVAIFMTVGLSACGESEPLTEQRYAPVDELIIQVTSAVASLPRLSLVADIDHSRMAAETGAVMPPARVIIFSDAALETNLLQQNQLLAVDLPLRVLAYEEKPGVAKAIYNEFDYLLSRYSLAENSALRTAHDKAYEQVLAGIPATSRTAFSDNSMQPDGMVTISSPYNFAKTIELIKAAINAQDDTVVFGEVDYQKSARANSLELRPTTLILFGAPAPGAAAMQKALTLGLDAFCQKFLVWQDEQGNVHLSYNDLLALAERQNVSKSIPLRVINFRLAKTFEAALDQ
ncbi:DUF302 domain-containing protein [Halieaceae bacterium IMCC14734]|uniref:DUF302 domain-containing protein n=1 Tax=Candidatus Litorirhabdus singularis TaxID=2518993 RepID=A0ABT3TI83_9GAMM|nr:DUF302 domain-containing protein [Candidatus Litorirhabdus singularis]MCX2982008.1 DUF302 domain-containing protein [Candidatus Litorirhabdus singularis]